MVKIPFFKKSPCGKNTLSVWFALGGSAAGSLFFALTHTLWEDAALPITSALATATPVLSFIADYAGEVRLFLPMVLLPILVRHPLPLYTLLSLRGFYLGMSLTYLFARSPSPALTVSYLLVGGGILFAYTALAHCAESTSFSLRSLAFPFLFYAGEIFLLTIIRNLTYFLFLP